MEGSKSYRGRHGIRFWYLPSKGKDYLHRLDGPAVEWSDGTKEWWVDGKRHRLDGPAIEDSDGTKVWYVHGERHRLDGPAAEFADGSNHWYVDGNELPIEEVEIWLEENKIDLKTEEGQMAFKLRWI